VVWHGTAQRSTASTEEKKNTLIITRAKRNTRETPKTKQKRDTPIRAQ
jgi:hypothetical protein